MFPIKIVLRKRLVVKNRDLEISNEILEFLKQKFIYLKADNVRIVNNAIRFDNRFFKFENNWNIMVPVDKGKVTITKEKKSEVVIEYLFWIKTIFIISGVAGLVLSLFSGEWTWGLGVFLSLGGLNWLIAVVRHSVMFMNLYKELKKRFLE